MFGVGGGILFVPTLVALGLGQLEAQGTSLLAILPTVARRRLEPAALRQPAGADGDRRRPRVDRRSRDRRPHRHRAAGERRCGSSSPSCCSPSPSSSSGGRADGGRATLIRRDPLRRRGRRCGGRRSPRSPAAAPPPRSATTGASAFLLRITIPGQDTVSLGELEWPTSTTADVQSFQYPADGSVVSVGRSRAAVFASPGSAAATQSFAEAIVLSLFNGEIVAGKVTASVSAGASARSVGSDSLGVGGAGPAGARKRRLEHARLDARRSRTGGR